MKGRTALVLAIILKDRGCSGDAQSPGKVKGQLYCQPRKRLTGRIGLCVLSLFFTAHALPQNGSNSALRWNSATLQGIRDAKLGAPVVARALAIVHTCMYDAWAANTGRIVLLTRDEVAVGDGMRLLLRCNARQKYGGDLPRATARFRQNPPAFLPHC
jgi:hypothetical protein